MCVWIYDLPASSAGLPADRGHETLFHNLSSDPARKPRGSKLSTRGSKPPPRPAVANLVTGSAGSSPEAMLGRCSCFCIALLGFLIANIPEGTHGPRSRASVVHE